MGFASLMRARVLRLPLGPSRRRRRQELLERKTIIRRSFVRSRGIKSDREKFPCRRCCQSANPMHRDIKIIVVAERAVLSASTERDFTA